MDSVKDNRDKYIGGSDFPIILGLSPYKTRFRLLLEKLKVIDDDFKGNEYTEYGNVMEPKIRKYLNDSIGEEVYKEDVLTLENVRCNVDGYCEDLNEILEIKTSTKPDLKNKVYLAQLYFYAKTYKADNTTLAVYENDNFNEEFNVDKLVTKDYSIEELNELFGVDTYDNEIKKFWEDFETLKTYNDLGMELTEDLITDNEIVVISNEIIQLEEEISSYKLIENKIKEKKEYLYNLMNEHNVSKWEMPNGTKITKVAETTSTKKVIDEAKIIDVTGIDIEEFKTENITKRKGYIKITVAKEE